MRKCYATLQKNDAGGIRETQGATSKHSSVITQNTFGMLLCNGSTNACSKVKCERLTFVKTRPEEAGGLSAELHWITCIEREEMWDLEEAAMPGGCRRFVGFH